MFAARGECGIIRETYKANKENEMNDNRKILAAAAAAATILSAGYALADVGEWKVPNWTTIVTEPGAVQKWVGKTWSGHCQGMCVSSDRKSTRLNSSHTDSSRMPSSA